MIQKLLTQDIDQVARIHRQELQGFLSELGEKFLSRFYKVSLDIPEMFTFVEKQGGQVLGFVAGVENTAGLYKKIILRDLLVFGILLLKYFITHPTDLLKPLQIIAYPGFKDDGPELLTIAVTKKQQRNGIGRKLFLTVAKEFQKRDIKRFKISVYNKLSSNRFYKKIGCQLEKSFVFLGEKMNYYVY